MFEVTSGGSGPSGITDEFKVVPFDFGEVKRHEVVGFVRLRLGVINERFLIPGDYGNDAAAVAGFVGCVSESSHVVWAVTRRFQFVGSGSGVTGNSVKTEFRPEFDGFVAHKGFFGAADFDADAQRPHFARVHPAVGRGRGVPFGAEVVQFFLQFGICGFGNVAAVSYAKEVICGTSCATVGVIFQGIPFAVDQFFHVVDYGCAGEIGLVSDFLVKNLAFGEGVRAVSQFQQIGVGAAGIMTGAFIGGSGGVDCASVVFAVAAPSAVFFGGEVIFTPVVEPVFGIRIGGFLEY